MEMSVHHALFVARCVSLALRMSWHRWFSSLLFSFGNVALRWVSCAFEDAFSCVVTCKAGFLRLPGAIFFFLEACFVRLVAITTSVSARHVAKEDSFCGGCSSSTMLIILLLISVSIAHKMSRRSPRLKATSSGAMPSGCGCQECLPAPNAVFSHRRDLDLACIDQVVRYILKTEKAVARNPAAPDYVGLCIFISGIVFAEGAAVTTGLAEKQEEKGKALQQERLYRDEMASPAKTQDRDGEKRATRASGKVWCVVPSKACGARFVSARHADFVAPFFPCYAPTELRQVGGAVKSLNGLAAPTGGVLNDARLSREPRASNQQRKVLASMLSRIRSCGAGPPKPPLATSTCASFAWPRETSCRSVCNGSFLPLTRSTSSGINNSFNAASWRLLSSAGFFRSPTGSFKETRHGFYRLLLKEQPLSTSSPKASLVGPLGLRELDLSILDEMCEGLGYAAHWVWSGLVRQWIVHR